MNVSCSHCSTTYRVDPAKIPAGGVRARCSHCGGVFDVAPAAAESVPAPAASALAPAPAPEPEPPAPPEAPAQPAAEATEAAPQSGSSAAAAAPVSEPEAAGASAPPIFGSSDPQAKARRLARVLVSDIVVYHPERRDRSLQNGTLRQEFREEIRKSWDEYVAQVGAQIARDTPYFREALNEILARGQRIF